MAAESSNAPDERVSGAPNATEASGAGPLAGVNSEAPPAVEGDDTEDEIRTIMRTLTSGTIIDGRYRVDDVLGRGAMGVVVAATHVQLGERAALKFLRIRGNAGGEDFQSRFRREAKVSAKLKNEHITRVIDVGVWREKVPFMVMEYLVGHDLRQTVKANGPLPLDAVLDYAMQVCTGIAEAHALGIIHRDLKASNLYLTKRADGSDLVKILDFGISKWTTDGEMDELTKTGVVLGSPKYMAPEQLFGANEVDARADVWSIGAIVYELLTGHPPYDFPTIMRVCAELSTDRMPPSIRELRDDVSPELEAALFRCFIRDPAKRVPNVAELAGSLLEAVGLPIAGAIRDRILAILDPAKSREALARSGPSLTLSGAFSALNARSSSGSASVSSLRVASPASTTQAIAAPVSSDASVSSSAEPPRKSRAGWLIGAVLLFGAIGVTVFLRSSSQAPPPPPTTAATAASTAVIAPPPATTQTTEPSSPATTTASAPPSASASATPASAATHPHRWGQPAPAPPPAQPTAVVTNAAPPPPPATTAAPPPPPPQKKTNPLEDRQ